MLFIDHSRCRAAEGNATATPTTWIRSMNTRAALRTSRPLARVSRSYATVTPIANATPSSSGGPQAPADYCASLVKRLDPEAWLTSYFWSRREKEWFLAWRAYNVSYDDLEHY